MYNVVLNNFLKKHNIIFNVEHTINNLIDIHKILTELNIVFYPAFGTFLGMYRSGDIISYDTDSDIALIDENYDKFINNINLFIEKGFEVIRTGNIISIKRNNNYTDFYYFKMEDGMYKCGQYSIDPIHFKEHNYLNVFGHTWLIFNKPEKYLEDKYGKDWKIPKINFSATT